MAYSGPPSDPSAQSQSRSPWFITSVLLFLVIIGLVIVGLLSVDRLNLALGPTPTLTATPRIPSTPTADFRATRFAEDQATQIAYQAIATLQTPAFVEVTTSPTITENNQISMPAVHNEAQPTATGSSLGLPIAGSDIQPSSPLPQPNNTLTATNVTIPPVDPLATPTPAAPSPIVIGETPTPTETPFIPPTDTPTFTPTPTPTVFLVSSLRGFIPATLTSVWVRLAPVNTQTPVATLVANTSVNLLGRDSTGEWVYFCCVNNEPRWLRQVYAQPTDNPTPPNAPPSSTPNDVRWLPTVPWPGSIAQPSLATPIPPDDFPLLRRDRANSGRVPGNFTGTLNSFWPVAAEAGQPFTSPPVVAGPYVVAASAEPSIYGFDRNGGNQNWKYSLQSPVSRPLAMQDNVLYFADDVGRTYALPIQGSPIWNSTLSIPNVTQQAPPATGFTVAGDRLFIVANNNNTYYVVQLDRYAGGSLNSFAIGSTPPKSLTVGEQMLYVAGSALWALDLHNLEVLWQRTDLTTINALPVYTPNGLTALAELFVATADNRVHLINANTGVEVRTYDGGGEVATSLALGDTMLYAAGNGFIKAYDRLGTGIFWRAGLSGEAVGGPLVSAGQIIVVTNGGVIHMVNPNGGAVATVQSLGMSVSQSPAVSGSYLFVPITGNRIYSYVQP